LREIGRAVYTDRDGNVDELESECVGTLLELLLDLEGNDAALRKELFGIVPRYSRFQHLVPDGRKHAVVEIDA